MPASTLETDYLVVGAGAAGMAFTDSLIAETGVDVVMVDRRSSPGGHWNDTYPFVRLHQPSLYYGVNSTLLGCDAIETRGPEAGWYERANGIEIRAYFARVMERQLIASGRVRFFPNSDCVGGQRFVSRLTGAVTDVKVRRKVVDATYLAPDVPALTPPPFDVGDDVAVIPVHRLVDVAERPDRYVVIGAGKTASDACVWLLSNGVDSDDIQWIKPREPWLQNRRYVQPGVLAGSMIEGLALQMEAAAQATSLDDLFERLEASGFMRRVDRNVRPTMSKGATLIGDWEIDLLRRIKNVVRLGHVRRIERDQIVLEHGTVPTSTRHLHVHCAASGLRRRPALPTFAGDRITLQTLGGQVITFNAALVAFVEAHRADDAEKNRLCPTTQYANTPRDWVRIKLADMAAERVWSKEADVQDWLRRARLYPARDVHLHAGDEGVKRAMARFAAHVGPGLKRLAALVEQTE